MVSLSVQSSFMTKIHAGFPLANPPPVAGWKPLCEVLEPLAASIRLLNESVNHQIVAVVPLPFVVVRVEEHLAEVEKALEEHRKDGCGEDTDGRRVLAEAPSSASVYCKAFFT